MKGQNEAAQHLAAVRGLQFDPLMNLMQGAIGTSPKMATYASANSIAA